MEQANAVMYVFESTDEKLDIELSNKSVAKFVGGVFVTQDEDVANCLKATQMFKRGEIRTTTKPPEQAKRGRGRFRASSGARATKTGDEA